MSSGRTHKTVGVFSGAGAVYLHNHVSQSQHHLTDYIGGVVGGYYGSKLADIVDPPTSPNHRSIGHGIIQNSILAKVIYENIAQFRKHCFQQAENYHQRANQCQEQLFQELLLRMLAEAFKFAAGLAAGLIAGHLSHLALDATTAKSLPLIF